MLVEPKKLTIRSLLERSFSLYASLDGIAFAGQSPMSYQEVETAVQDLAVRLLRVGVEKGQAVAILGDNAPNWVLAYLATAWIGAVVVPILPGFPEADIRHILRNADVVALFIADKQRSKIEGFEYPGFHSLFSLETLELEQAQPHAGKAVAKVEADLKKSKGEAPTSAEILAQFPQSEPEDLAAIIYTSGTTGNSKGVMLTHANIVSDVVNSVEKFPLTTKDRFLSILPLAHTFEATGGMLCPLSRGVSIYYMQGMPTPQKLLSSMQAVKPTGVLTVPLVVDKIYRKRILPKFQSKKALWALYQTPFLRKGLNKTAGKKLVESLGGALRFFMFGGAALNEDVETFLRDAGISYSTGYGMTETAPILTINPFGKVKVGSCGQPIPSIEIRIHNPDSETGIGEIIVKGPNVMQGYYKNPEATGEVFLKDGWLKTGDLGYFDSEGYLFIKGRSKNIIVGPSGENIYPEIIEAMLLQSPYIQQVIVYEEDGRVVAKAYPDYDVMDAEFEHSKKDQPQAAELVTTILDQARQEVNANLPAFSAITKITEYPEPFEMTPTNKVKRYLYI